MPLILGSRHSLNEHPPASLKHKKMEERKRQELLEHWKWIVRAVFQAEYNLGQRGERINKEAEDKDKEADRWVTLVADEILSNTIDKDNESES